MHTATAKAQRATNELGDPTGFMADGTVAPSVDLMGWVAENRHLMVPPVGNKYLYSGQDFFVMIIAGPNARNDFHMTDSEEFFIQLKGDITVRIRDKDGIKDVPVRELAPPEGVVHVGNDWRYAEWVQGGFIATLGLDEVPISPALIPKPPTPADATTPAPSAGTPSAGSGVGER